MIASAALVGFGEAGSILARDLEVRGVARLSAYDPLFATPASPAARNLQAAPSIRRAASAADAVDGAELVVLAVTAGSDLESAASLAGALGSSPFVVDINAVSPGVKRTAAEMVTVAGGRYVEAAVMASLPPTGIATPVLLGGPHAHAFLQQARALGMQATVYSEEIGRASSVKMCRSVVIKGLEAILLEGLCAARAYGVERDVLASLCDTIPGADWPQLARYMIGRAVQHGRRRAEEMQEAARTVAETGLQPLLASAIADRQAWAARAAASTTAQLAGADLAAMLDGLTEAVSGHG